MEINKKAAVDTLLQLPTDILEEILSRLRVKDLVRFKSVSKTCFRIVSSQRFIRRHLNKSMCRSIRSYSFALNPCARLASPYGTYYIMEFAGTCDGLVCRYEKDRGIIHISNPAIRQATCVPATTEPPGTIMCFWFGRVDDRDNEYKLLVGSVSHMHLIRPYIDKGRWKSTRAFGRKYCCYDKIGTLCNGAVHWAVAGKIESSATILSYDLEKETIGEIRGPDYGKTRGYFVIGEVDGCLCALFSGLVDYEMWGMKEYGVGESWTKLMSLPTQFVRSLDSLSQNEPEMLIDDPATVRSPLYHKMRYVESLVSPLRGDDSCGVICRGRVEIARRLS